MDSQRKGSWDRAPAHTGTTENPEKALGSVASLRGQVGLSLRASRERKREAGRRQMTKAQDPLVNH